ncbi:MAG: hypothetical protein JOY82_13495 [Streptosporangiaceae bacterium]|nr:hypothetical protein [Streptosporangiaceae bacterium]MBV9855508.1 hypothetical protein [Streptosporangiaceae bacterium]
MAGESLCQLRPCPGRERQQAQANLPRSRLRAALVPLVLLVPRVWLIPRDWLIVVR